LETELDPWVRSKSRIICSLVEGERILEVGCGIGTLTKSLSEQKRYRIVAIDSSQICLKKAREKRLDVVYMQQDICNPSNLLQYTNHFDSAVVSDVLEHIKDDQRALTNINLLLKEDGAVVLTVPAFQMLYSNHDRKVGHLRRYSKREIVRKLSTAGYDVEICRYWNFLGLLGWITILKVLKRKLLDVSSFLSSVSGVFQRWLLLEEKEEFPIGLTIVIKARKKRIPTNVW